MAIVITRHTAIKLVELILVCILIAVYYGEEGGASQSHRFLATGTFFGYLIILIGVFAGGLMGTPINRRVDLFYCLIGCVLFIAIGAIWIGSSNYRGGKNNVIGWVSAVNGVIFLVDAILVFRNEP